MSIEEKIGKNVYGIEVYLGVIVLGFINMYCYLELFYMLGKVNIGIGLLEFIRNVVFYWEVLMEEIEVVIIKVD